MSLRKELDKGKIYLSDENESDNDIHLSNNIGKVEIDDVSLQSPLLLAISTETDSKQNKTGPNKQRAQLDESFETNDMLASKYRGNVWTSASPSDSRAGSIIHKLEPVGDVQTDTSITILPQDPYDSGLKLVPQHKSSDKKNLRENSQKKKKLRSHLRNKSLEVLDMLDAQSDVNSLKYRSEAAKSPMMQSEIHTGKSSQMKIKFPDDCDASSENDENPEQLKLKLPLPRISEAVKIEELNNLENSMDEKSEK